MELKFTAGEKDAGKTVYTVMRRELDISATLLRRLKNAGGFSVNGISVYSTFVLSAGDVLLVDITSCEPPCGILPQSGPVDILYEDRGFLAVNKPCGILTHPSRAKYTDTLANFVAGYLEEKENDGRCHAVNRLDRDTGGVVLFAKNSYMKELGCRALKEDSAEKVYLAVAYGKMESPSGTVDYPIKRLRAQDMLRVTAPDGQSAVTHYRVIGEIGLLGEALSVLELRLETGRTHQIRVHMNSIGHPLLGDVLYYNDASRALSVNAGITAQMLHARLLSFREPLSGKSLTLEAPIKRADMRDLVSAAGGEV